MIAHKLAEATPDELPACGKELQYPTDLEIEGLKGKVKSISHLETEEDQGKQIRSLRSTRDYGLDGRLRLVLRFDSIVRILGPPMVVLVDVESQTGELPTTKIDYSEVRELLPVTSRQINDSKRLMNPFEIRMGESTSCIRIATHER